MVKKATLGMGQSMEGYGASRGKGEADRLKPVITPSQPTLDHLSEEASVAGS